LAQQDLEQAREAKVILESKAFQNAFEECRLDYLQALLNSDPEETDKRERVYFSLKILDRVKDNLVRFINAGELELGRRN
tara:strand:+ start:1477 stop:1716 length:240 start_codon:yes stop_codon:yes gene_type:complete